MDKAWTIAVARVPAILELTPHQRTLVRLLFELAYLSGKQDALVEQEQPA